MKVVEKFKSAVDKYKEIVIQDCFSDKDHYSHGQSGCLNQIKTWYKKVPQEQRIHMLYYFLKEMVWETGYSDVTRVCRDRAIELVEDLENCF